MSTSPLAASLDTLRDGRPGIFLTVYDALVASIAASAEPTALIVGDTLGVNVAGMADVYDVTLEQMQYHARAARVGAPRVPIVIDLPLRFLREPSSIAAHAARQLVAESGGDAVKIEGSDAAAIELFQALREREVLSFGHLVADPSTIDQQIADGRRIEEAGARALVLEGFPLAARQRACAHTTIPIIGVGDASGCHAAAFNTLRLLGLLPTGGSLPLACGALRAALQAFT